MTDASLTTPHFTLTTPAPEDLHDDILSPQALTFIAALHTAHDATRRDLLAARHQRQLRLDAGERPDFLRETRHIRQAEDWRVAPVPHALTRRVVEITGPPEAKMILNALNSGADVFMADFEDAMSPTWHNVLSGQQHLAQAIRRTLTFEHPTKGTYSLNEQVATLLVRPRGWHLEERHLLINGKPASASLFDLGLYLFHNAQELLQRDAGPYFYLPKLESYLEARLWRDVFATAESLLHLEPGTIKVTVLLEHILLAFEIEEVLWELRPHIVGINAGRWDYIFSAIKKFRQQDVIFPDRAQITMMAPFMRAYTELLVQTCHKRGAHAIGGMAAFIPSRDPRVNAQAMERVTADKQREVRDGFDGTWVAHPGLVQIARDTFEAVLGDRPHQRERLRPEVQITRHDLLNFTIEGGKVTERGARQNISVGIAYLAHWLCGQGAVALHDLMEDAATAEISRSQLWQWLTHKVAMADGRPFTRALYDQLVEEELEKLRDGLGDEAFFVGRYPEARALFDRVATSAAFEEFLTLPAYQAID